MKFLIIYSWLLSLLGAIFLGHEIAYIKHRMDREAYSNKLNNCNRIVSGSIYEGKK